MSKEKMDEKETQEFNKLIVIHNFVVFGIAILIISVSWLCAGILYSLVTEPMHTLTNAVLIFLTTLLFLGGVIGFLVLPVVFLLNKEEATK